MSTAVAPSSPSSSTMAAKMKSLADHRDAGRAAEPEAPAGDAAVGHGEGGQVELRGLHAHRPDQRPEPAPQLHALLHVAERAEGDVRAPGEQQHAHGQVRRPLGRHPDQHQEQREEQQRRAEVALQHHDHEGHAPGDEHRAEVLGVGQRDAARRPG